MAVISIRIHMQPEQDELTKLKNYRRDVQCANYIFDYHLQNKQWDSNKLTIHQLASFVFQKNKEFVRQHNELRERSISLSRQLLHRAKQLNFDQSTLYTGQPNPPLSTDHLCLERVFLRNESPTFEQRERMFDVHDQNCAIYSLILNISRSNSAAECILQAFKLIENIRVVEIKELQQKIHEATGKLGHMSKFKQSSS